MIGQWDFHEIHTVLFFSVILRNASNECLLSFCAVLIFQLAKNFMQLTVNLDNTLKVGMVGKPSICLLSSKGKIINHILVSIINS